MSSHLPPHWEKRVLVAVGAASVRRESVRFLAAQAQAEGGDAQWNPTNTTFPLPGATDYNQAGVKNYPHATWGVAAVACTLSNGFYPGLLGDLQSGRHTAEQIVARNRAEIQRWGTNPDLILRILASE